MSVTLLFLAFLLGVGACWAVFRFRRPLSPSSRRFQPAAPNENDDRYEFIDALTGLYAPPHLMRRLADYSARAERERKTFALILWDVNEFILFNNAYGRSEGDRILKEVTTAIRSSLRPYDELFRSGEDEFCALVMPADAELIHDMTERIRARVAATVTGPDVSGRKRSISVSYGWCFGPGESLPPEALLHAAQQDLYKKKK